MSDHEDDAHTATNPNILVTSQFKTVWQEYYESESDLCARTLSTLLVVKPARPRRLSVSTTEVATQEARPISVAETLPSSNDTVLSFYTLADEQWNSSSVDVETIVQIELPSPCPAYESCAPLQQNILHGDDPNFMPFLPYADEPTFDSADHALEYKALAWQENYRDPDSESRLHRHEAFRWLTNSAALEIVLETARRLHSVHGLSPTQIDDTNVLPLTLRTTDSILWPGSSRLSCALPDIPAPRAEDLRRRLQDYLTLWCPQPDCLQAHCFSHSKRVHRMNPGVSATSFRCLPATSACGNSCIIESGSTSEDDVRWSSQDIDDLRTISQLGTPMTSCDLAVLCRKPCYEVRSRQKAPFRCVLSLSSVGEMLIVTSNDPCAHRGPCGQSSDCACFLNKAHCSRNCRCARDCSRRWQGCKCALYGRPSKSKAPQTCSGKHCPCWSANRECDPDVCLPCHPTCRSRQLQTGIHKASHLRNDYTTLANQRDATEVKAGKYGFGLFLTQDAKQGDLITEYLGELIYEPTFLCRDQLTSHVGRSYVFCLNKSISVDAFPAGNEARFINHTPSEEANVAVSILLIHGEQRIGVFASESSSPHSSQGGG
ncbi:SET domain-containing protein [Trametes versicolor FP-101664 SS1]|uniref:SET domain-containing protein n=1 Tax=Trametes versicolor (strain FP-101664) TaxID=717944 RepID=UPI00046222EC|nr:SET domain-containing protein [Trametes versicolor FP-101664 SS1]EIW52185.1 SET domain-containing protein [Trametes versicolor FP-101664 SS1]